MDIFLSWSGDRSRQVAEALRDWLPDVIQTLDPWISRDIEKGARWGHEIAEALSKSRFGIFCLTPENLGSAWLHFEAGAISKLPQSAVCTLLLDLPNPGAIAPPLGSFQHTQPIREDMFKLVGTINNAVASCGERALPPDRLASAFDMHWTDLDKRLKDIAAMPGAGTATPKRSCEESIAEVLDILREQERNRERDGLLTRVTAALLQDLGSATDGRADQGIAALLRASELQRLLPNASKIGQTSWGALAATRWPDHVPEGTNAAKQAIVRPPSSGDGEQ